MDDDLEAIIRQTVLRFRRISLQFADNQKKLESVYAEEARLNEQQQVLQQLANQCYSAANLFQFDLASELARAPPDMIPAGTSTTEFQIDLKPNVSEAKTPTVKEFIVERARLAFPKPVRAAALRRAFEEMSNKTVHDKTFGMSLYRLSLEGVMKREGNADWYFVPEDQREQMPSAPEPGDMF